MKNLFEPATVREVKDRVAQLKPNSPRLWGKMNVAQAVAHCSASVEWAVGDKVPPRMFFGSIVGRIIKPLVLRDSEPMRRNSPTSAALVVADERDLQTEQGRLVRLIDRFATGGPHGCTTHPHSFFGPLKPQEWATLMYKHLDHHLCQFGV